MVQLLLVLIEFGTITHMHILNYKIIVPIIVFLYIVIEMTLDTMKKLAFNIQYLLDQFLNIKNKGELIMNNNNNNLTNVGGGE